GPQHAAQAASGVPAERRERRRHHLRQLAARQPGDGGRPGFRGLRLPLRIRHRRPQPPPRRCPLRRYPEMAIPVTAGSSIPAPMFLRSKNSNAPVRARWLFR
ncbi:MAG: hypothetical protein J4F45_10320, partial [Pseudomonadales bacterium]|nr:hypothetical protein [Pseudomonadales bacterium]